MKTKNIFRFSLLLASLMVVSSCGPVGSSSSLTPSSEEPSSEDVSSEESSEEISSEEISSEESSETPSPFGLSINMPEGRPLRIMQFADIHFGQASKAYHNDKVTRTKEYMQYLVDTVDPDLIVCTGDNIMTTGVNGLKSFADLLDSYQTPWAFIYGNHDAESTNPKMRKSDLSEYLLNLESPYLLYEEGYIEETANRYGNYVINVLDSTGEKLQGSIFLMDAGVYDYDISSYESLTDGQIDWYSSEVDRLNALYNAQEGNAHDVVPSIVFSHIQLPEFHTVLTDAIANNGASFVIEQELNEDQIADVQSGGPTIDTTNMYETMVEKGSTKAFFVGHAHTYKFQIKDDEDNIVLGFGPQTGFSRTFEDNDLARTNYTYNLSEDFTFTTTETKEVAEDAGFGYGGTYEGFASMNSEGNYQVRLTFAIWNRIVFSFNGIRLKLADFAEITGCYNPSGTATWDENLYSTDGVKLIYSGSRDTTFIFTYNPTANTLDIKVYVEPDIDDDPVELTLEPTTIECDAGADAVAVWTSAGTKFKEAGNNWMANGWRYFVIVDSEGKVAYAVSNPPNGYGGPMGTGYYCHPDYAVDYAANPVFNILEGYGPWTQEDPTASGLYEVQIPEGFFAITGHGVGILDMVVLMGAGEVSDLSDANLNRRGVFDDGLRLSYDKDENLISAEFVEVEEEEEEGVKATLVNADAGGDSIGVWTNEGHKLKTVDGGWSPNGWRYYIFIDSEGKIAYACLYPADGYGAPHAYQYYCHPDYASDYKTNPALNVLDTYSEEDASQFEALVPEGGFALTSHGQANAQLINLFSNGLVTDYEAKNINRTDIYDANVRVFYNPSTYMISCTYGE